MSNNNIILISFLSFFIIFLSMIRIQHLSKNKIHIVLNLTVFNYIIMFRTINFLNRIEMTIQKTFSNKFVKFKLI